MNINTTIADIQAEFDRLKNIIEEQKLELAQLKSEGLSKIDSAWRTPSPDRDPNKELLNSMIQARANELQVSEGIMWGLVVDMVKRDGMNLEVDELPEPEEPFTGKCRGGMTCDNSFEYGPVCEQKPVSDSKLKVGDYFWCKIYGDEWKVLEETNPLKCICTKSGSWDKGEVETWFVVNELGRVPSHFALGRHPENQPNPLADLDPFTCELKEGDVCEVVEVYFMDRIEGKILGQKITVQKQNGDCDTGLHDIEDYRWSRSQLKLISRP